MPSADQTPFLRSLLRRALVPHRYALWSGLGLALYAVRSHLVVNEGDTMLYPKIGAYAVSVGGVLMMGAQKIQRDYHAIGKKAKEASPAAAAVKKE